MHVLDAATGLWSPPVSIAPEVDLAAPTLSPDSLYLGFSCDGALGGPD